MTSPNSDWALIIHADSGQTRVDVYWVDIRAGRLGLSLAREVKAWRKRDDLLTLGQRFRVVDGPSPTHEQTDRQQDDENHEDDDGDAVSTHSASLPPVPPTLPQDDRRTLGRVEYLRGRVKAVVAHSDVAAFHLQRIWPTGVPGLKQGGHSMMELDAIQLAVIRVETDHTVPWYPEWEDPDVETSKVKHPSWSDRWANPGLINDEPSSAESVEARLAIQQGIVEHPRRALLTKWVSEAISGGVNATVDTTALAHALYEFASVPEKEWPDDDLTVMLEGCLRTMGYVNGIRDLGNFDPLQSPVLMSCAFAIAAGNATLLFGDDGNPSVIIDVIGKSL